MSAATAAPQPDRLGSRATFQRYAVAVAAAVIAIAIRLGLSAAASHSLFVVAAAAVSVSAWYGGLGPGLVSTALCASLATFLFLDPGSGVRADNAIPRLLIFLPIGIEISLLFAAVRKSQWRAEIANLETREALAQRDQSLALLDSILETAPVGHVFVDGDLRYRRLNRAFAEMLAESGVHVGRRLTDVQGPIAAEIASLCTSVIETGIPVLERELAGNGGQRSLVSSCSLVRVRNEVVGASVLVVDETTRKRLEDDLRAALAVRDDFLSMASHELRNPLSALQLQIELLLKSAPVGPDNPRLTLERARGQIRRMVHLLSDLLDLTRIQTGHLSLEPEELDLVDLVQEVMTREREEIARARSEVRLVAAEPCLGRWDRLRLDQVVTNLLSNALKYGSGKPIDVSVVRANGGAELAVLDHGIGIALEDQSRIFERFERAHSGRGIRGCGLGLWIVRQVVEASGGSVAVTSELGQGARFLVHLPFGPRALATPSREAVLRSAS